MSLEQYHPWIDTVAEYFVQLQVGVGWEGGSTPQLKGFEQVLLALLGGAEMRSRFNFQHTRWFPNPTRVITNHK